MYTGRALHACADVPPVKIKDSPNRQYVIRIPRDVLSKARGQTVTVEIDGRMVAFRIGPTANVVKFSLRQVTLPWLVPAIGPLPTTCPLSALIAHTAAITRASAWGL